MRVSKATQAWFKDAGATRDEMLSFIRSRAAYDEAMGRAKANKDSAYVAELMLRRKTAVRAFNLMLAKRRKENKR
jgi:hypothetical protein